MAGALAVCSSKLLPDGSAISVALFDSSGGGAENTKMLLLVLCNTFSSTNI
jgi:hypothetical protein